MAMQRAEGAHASEMYRLWLDLVREGKNGASSAAKVLLDAMDRRWKFGGDVHLLQIPRGTKRTDDIRAMLLRPSARLRALLAETGWNRPPEWQPPTKLLKAAPEPEEEP
jgi:hypothetical protein